MAWTKVLVFLTVALGVFGSPECGQTPIAPRMSTAFIVNGDEARPHSLPWQVSLEASILGIDLGHSCGASVLSERWVLTAAHCIEKRAMWSYTVVVGSHAINYEDPKQASYAVKTAYPHEKFDMNDPTDYDIALLELSEPIKFNDHVQPICLPERNHHWPEDTPFLVSGWGDLGEYDQSGGPDFLQQVVVPLMDHDTCGSMYKRLFPGAIHNRVLCAGYPKGGQDACQGDSGGPLVAKVGDSWVQAGVVSWGLGCARAKRPGVYTDIRKYRNWMDAIMH